MLRTHRNETGKKGAMVFLFPGENPWAVEDSFPPGSNYNRANYVLWCVYNSPVCPRSKTFHLYVLEFATAYSKHCFIQQQHFLSKGEMGTNACLRSFPNDVKYTDMFQSTLLAQIKIRVFKVRSSKDTQFQLMVWFCS